MNFFYFSFSFALHVEDYKHKDEDIVYSFTLDRKDIRSAHITAVERLSLGPNSGPKLSLSTRVNFGATTE